MRVLLDSHTLLWVVDDPPKLGTTAAAILRDLSNDILISAATVWELGIKVGLGKLMLSSPFRAWIDQAVGELGADLLPITVGHVDRQATLPFHHRDPFDRLLIAQAMVEGVAILGADGQFDAYGVQRLW